MAVRETPSQEDCMCTATNVDKDPVDQWIGEDKDPDDREAEREADKDREADKKLTVAEDKEPVVSDLNVATQVLEEVILKIKSMPNWFPRASLT